MTPPATFTPPAPLKTAVLFLVFNRPDTTVQVFEAIRKANPPRLYVAADGPRPEREGESEQVIKVREIATAVDWVCEVKTLFRDKNLGCMNAVSGAITWFFENEEQGIILEDDCLPSQSFFWFCEELLERYKGNDRILIISGYNKQGEWHSDKMDYFFSNFGGIWGWASWRRAWQYYDEGMFELEKICKTNFFEKLLGKKLGKKRKNQLLNAKKKIQLGEMNTWDYPWAYSRHLKGGGACVPSKSLISNIGFGENATHTFGSQMNSVDRNEIKFPTKPNNVVVFDEDYDLKFIGKSSIIKRAFIKLKRIFSI